MNSGMASARRLLHTEATPTSRKTGLRRCQIAWRQRLRPSLVSGRRGRSLYHDPGEIPAELLEGSVADLRIHLGLPPGDAPATPGEQLAFAGWTGVALLLGLTVLLAVLSPLAALAWLALG